MEPNDQATGISATVEDIQEAVEALTTMELARLRKAATVCLPGTEFQDFQELINEALLRALSAAAGGSGRRWRTSVAFMAFLTMTIRGIADDSRQSPVQTKTDRIEALATEGGTGEDAIGALGHRTPSVLDVAVASQDALEEQERLARVEADARLIDEHFAENANVTWIIMGEKDGESASAIREISGMTITQYETARKQLRRGTEKLFLGRRKS